MAHALAKTPTGIGRKAQIWSIDGRFTVKLYDTVIYDENRTTGKLTLDNGGWVTPTTARYINQIFAHRGASNRVGIRKGVMVMYVTRGFVSFEGGKLVIELQKAVA